MEKCHSHSELWGMRRRITKKSDQFCLRNVACKWNRSKSVEAMLIMIEEIKLEIDLGIMEEK